MTETSNILAERVKARLGALEKTARSVSIQATGKPDTLRYIMRGVTPASDKLFAISTALETSLEYLLGMTDDPKPRPEHLNYMKAKDEVDILKRTISEIKQGQIEVAPHYRVVRKAYRGMVGDVETMQDTKYERVPRGAPDLTMPKDIPIYGTALGSDARFEGIGNESIAIEQTDLNKSEAIDFMRRPPYLVGRSQIYALYVAGTSMEPVIEAGAPIIVDPTRPPSINDYVVVYLADPTSEDGATAAVLIKRLRRRSASFVELEQFSPAGTFRIGTERIQQMHKMLSLSEILGI